MKKNDWILGNPKNALVKDAEFWNDLSKEAYLHTHGTLRIPISLEPFLLKSKEYETLRNDLMIFMNAATKMAEAYYTDPRIAEILSIDKRERDLIENARDKSLTGIARLDLFYGDTVSVVEINTDYPDGFFMHDITAHKICDALPDSSKIIRVDHARQFSDLLEKEGVTKSMHIFVGFDKERFFIDEFYLAQQQLKKLGWDAVSVGAFEDLTFTDGSFYFNGIKVDVLRRGSELSKIRKIPDFIPRLLEAEKNGLIIINNFKMRLLGYKSLLAALWDERFHSYLTQQEIDIIKKILPRTYKLDDSAINKELLLEEKDAWVIKPIDLAEGTDVVVGQGKNTEEWVTALERAYVNPTKWIAQQKIDIPEATFNLVEEHHTKISSYLRKYDCNPHIILKKDGMEIGNILVRFSASSVVNVAQGGGITYAFPLSS